MVSVTLLFVPADRPERYGKAASSGADAIIIDLEDAVAPDAKWAAREALCRAGALPAGAEILVRANARGTEWHDADVAAITGLGLAGIVLPKAEDAGYISDLYGRTKLPVTALIETARGLSACREISRAAGVARLAFGSIDFCADIGAAHMRDALLAARSEIVLASRLGNLPPPIDGVTTSIEDAALIEDDARYAHALGFGGKLCIHPKQISSARRGFAAGADEIAWAQRILAAPEGGAVAAGGMMIDAPVRARARRILGLEKL
jgi:citrate lyase subunit beta/citryl-CoA lyase